MIPIRKPVIIPETWFQTLADTITPIMQQRDAQEFMEDFGKDQSMMHQYRSEERWVKKILQRLAPHAGRPDFKWKIDLLPSSPLSAACLPGSSRVMIFSDLIISLRTMNKLQSNLKKGSEGSKRLSEEEKQQVQRVRKLGKVPLEHQIAGAIGHEMAHGVCHAPSLERRILFMILKPLASLSATIGLAPSVFGLLPAAYIVFPWSFFIYAGLYGGSYYLINSTYGLLDAHWSRCNELEADKVGLHIMKKAGYDPRGMVMMYESLASMNLRRRTKWYDHHPCFLERLQALKIPLEKSGIKWKR